MARCSSNSAPRLCHLQAAWTHYTYQLPELFWVQELSWRQRLWAPAHLWCGATGNPLNPHSRSLSKYPLGINHDKNASALGQHFSFRVPDFCQMREPPSALRELPRFDTQRGLKRYRLQVIDA